MAVVRDTVLANGLTVIVAEIHSSPLVTVEVVVRTGAFTQVRGEEGVSHLFEHLLFRAYTGDAGFGGDVAALQGTYNGSTSEESVNYFITAPSMAMPGAVQMLARLVVAPRFRDRDIEAERSIVLAEVARQASQSGFVLRSEMGRRLWGADWTRKDALGTEQSIQAVDRSRVRAIYARFYAPNNAAIVVSGDVRTADVFEQVAKRFGPWKQVANPLGDIPRSAAPSLSATQTFAVSTPHERVVSVTVEWPGPSARGDSAGARAAALFATLVNLPTSPLANRLVNTGLVRAAGMTYLPQDRSGPIALTVVMLPDMADRVLPLLRDEIARFASPEYLNEFLRALALKAGALERVLDDEHGSGLAHGLAFRWAVAGATGARPASTEEPAGLADLERFVKSTIAGRPFVAGAITGPTDVERVRQLMAATFTSPR